MTSPYVVSYDQHWPAYFQQEFDSIKSVFDGQLALHHIGSTAVPGMAAKPCIDMLGVIEDKKAAELLIQSMSEFRYDYRGEYGIKGRYYFVKTSPRKYHFHVFFSGSREIDKHLYFVKAMKANPGLIKKFNQLKFLLQDQNPKDRTNYQRQKAFFYEEIFIKWSQSPDDYQF